ncbi:MAG: hypothetical protein WD871_06045 [Xanthobacteraceae bacterium]
MKGSNLLFLAAAVATLLAIVIGTTQAMQVGQAASSVKQAVEEQSLVQPAHSCHDLCVWGPVNGFHRHVGRQCRVVRC